MESGGPDRTAQAAQMARLYQNKQLTPTQERVFEELVRRGEIPSELLVTDNPPEQQLPLPDGPAAAAPESPGEGFQTAVDAATGLNTEVESLGRGILQAAGRAAQSLGIDTAQFLQGLAESEAQARQQVSEAQERSPVATRAGQVAGVLGPAVVAGVGAGTAATTAGRLGIGGAEGAAFGAAQFAEEGESKLANALIGFGLGTAVAGGFELGRKAVGAVTGAIRPPTGAQRVAEAADVAPEAQARGQAARAAASRQGVTTLTPGEATQSPRLLQGEGRVFAGGEGATRADRALAQRNIELREGVAKIINSIVPEGSTDEQIAAIQRAAYKQVTDTPVPKTIREKMMKRSTIQAAIKEIQKDPDLADGLDPGTLGYWNAVKIEIDGQIGELLQKGQNGRAAVKRNIRKELVDVLDELNPDYAAAREIGQRVGARSRLLEELGPDFQDDLNRTLDLPTATQKLFTNPANFKKLADDLRNVPGAQQRLKDMRLILQSIKNSPLPRLAKQSQEVGAASIAPPSARAVNAFNQLNRETTTKQYLDLILSDEWTEALSNAAKQRTAFKKVDALQNILAGQAGASAARPEQED